MNSRKMIAFSILVLSITSTGNALATDILEAARKASIAANEKLHSVQGSGTVTVYRRNLSDKDEMPWTDGSFKLSYDRGKHCLDIKFTRLLRRTRYTDANGVSIEKVVDWSPDRVVIVADGQAASVVTFSTRIHPSGCRIEIFDSVESAAEAAGFPIRNPAYPWLETANVDGLLKNIEKDKIVISELENGRIRGTYHLKNSQTAYADFEIDPRSGNNVVSIRVFNRPSLEPATTYQLNWALADSVWYVTQFNESNLSRLIDDAPIRTRTVFKFDSFIPNKSIDQSLFKIDSLPIPPGTRTLDLR